MLALGTTRAHSCSCAVSDEHLCPFSLDCSASSLRYIGRRQQQPMVVSNSRRGQAVQERLGPHVYRGGKTSWPPNPLGQWGAKAYWAIGACLRGLPSSTGWSGTLWRIQVFGRWSSNAFLKYVRTSPLASLCIASQPKTAISESIAAAKSELRALTVHAGKLLEDPAKGHPSLC